MCANCVKIKGISKIHTLTSHLLKTVVNFGKKVQRNTSKFPFSTILACIFSVTALGYICASLLATIYPYENLQSHKCLCRTSCAYVRSIVTRFSVTYVGTRPQTRTPIFVWRKIYVASELACKPSPLGKGDRAGVPRKWEHFRGFADCGGWGEPGAQSDRVTAENTILIQMNILCK